MAERRAGSPINKPVARLGIAIFLTVNVVMFTMVLWSNDVYSTAPSGGGVAPAAVAAPIIGDRLDDVIRWLVLVLSAPVIWLLAGPLASNAWQELRRGVAAVDLLLVLGVAAAFLYSVVSVVRGHGHVYFEIACVVLVLVTLGRWFEAAGKQCATQAIETLSTLLPRTALRIDGSGEHPTPLADLRQGDRIRILPGERIAADGCIASGVAAIDEQLVTGESRSVVKQPGDTVYGGALNLDGQLVVRVAAESGRGTLQRMVEAVRQARLMKGHYQRLADRIASWFLPAAIVVALVAMAWHAQHCGAGTRACWRAWRCC